MLVNQIALGDTNVKTTNNFKGSNVTFKVQGASLDKNQLVFGVGAKAKFGKQAKLVASYDDQNKKMALGFGVNF